MYDTRPRISKEKILKYVSQEEIFKMYLTISPVYGARFKNPLRDDNNPDCVFYIDGRGVIKFRDIAMGWNWDCFNVVEYRYNLSFSEALSKIGTDFKLIDGEQISTEREIILKEPLKPRKVIIEIKARQWNTVDRDYWLKNLIHKKTLEFYNVVPVRNYWINGDIKYFYSDNDPCYAYWFGPYEYILYMPLRKKGSVRFIQNVRNRLQGYDQLPESGDLLLLTKSLKDVMLAYEFGISSTATLGETTYLSNEQFSDLYNRFDTIISLLDFDRAGITAANRYRKQYEIQPFFLTNGRFNSIDYGAKDLTEFGSKFGEKDLLDLLEYGKSMIWKT